MAYSLVGILAIAVYIIINFGVFLDVIHNQKKFRGEKYYLFFLISAIVFHIADAGWGFLYDAKLSTALFIDTTFYFIAMASSILLWGVFIYSYLDLKKQKNRWVMWINAAIFVFQIVVIFINFFWRVLFDVYGDCIYEARPLRYVNLGVQVLMYLILAMFTLLSAGSQRGSERRKHITISLFCLFMILAIILQVFFPLMPMYSLGYLLGICILHTFVFRDTLTNSQHELDETKHQIEIDALTGVYSKHAYIDVEDEIEKKIANGAMCDFAMVVFDLNDLKLINDTYGHEAGDNYLIDSTKLIEEYFKDVPVYRVGGDEFCAILMGNDFENREKLFKSFNKRIDVNLKNNDRVIISSGIATFDPAKDSTIMKVFTRADKEMYIRKQELKDQQK